MNADATRQLTQERRARLAAERKLELRQADLRRGIDDMERRARVLTDTILEKRAQLVEMQRELAHQQRETQAALARTKAAEDERATSESRLWLALEAVRDGFAMYDSDARLTCANRAFLSIFDGLDEVKPGVTYDRLCEILLEEGIVDPRMPSDAWLERMHERWRQAVIPTETICLWDGQFVKLNDRRLADGGVVALGLNQTYERRITSAIEAIHDGFVIFDRDDNLVMCNQRYRDLFPGEADLIRPGANFQDILRHGAETGGYPDAIGREADWIEDRMRLFLSPPDTPFEQEMTGGSWIRTIDTETPDGGRVGLRTDVTETKRIEAALRDARRAAEVASRAKSQFLTNMNHEFRTPLNGIIGLASILRERAPDNGTRQMVRTMENSAQALLGIVETVLQTAQHDVACPTATCSRLDLTVAIAQVVMLLSPKMHLGGIDLTLDYADHVPELFRGDDLRLRQVLASLLGNAYKFSEGGKVTLRIDGAPRVTDDDDACGPAPIWDLHISVEDDGLGVPPGAVERIFQPFAQADDSHGRAHDGVGLGLSLCRSLLDLMGGTIWLDEEFADGAKFCVSLSLAQHVDDDITATDFPPCYLVRERDVLGQLLERRVSRFGMELDCFTPDELPPPDRSPRILLVQPGALAVDPEDRLKQLAQVPQSRIILLGSKVQVNWQDIPNCVQVDGPPVDWIAFATLLASQDDAATKEEQMPRKLRVLAAEDNRTNQLVLRKLLEPFDIDLTIVPSGAEAVQSVSDAPPDLIFMDISMPGMDGKEATARIRDWQQETGHDPIPVVAMTAHAMEDDRRVILAAGLDDYMAKPLSRDGLGERIAQVQAALRRKAGASGSDNSGA